MVHWVQPSGTTIRSEESSLLNLVVALTPGCQVVATTLIALADLLTLLRLTIRIRTGRFWLDDVCQCALNVSPTSLILFNRGHYRVHLLYPTARQCVDQDRLFTEP